LSLHLAFASWMMDQEEDLPRTMKVTYESAQIAVDSFHYRSSRLKAVCNL
jgi:hypothetical protein